MGVFADIGCCFFWKKINPPKPPGKADSYQKPSFFGTMLVFFWGVLDLHVWIFIHKQIRRVVNKVKIHMSNISQLGNCMKWYRYIEYCNQFVIESIETLQFVGRFDHTLGVVKGYGDVGRRKIFGSDRNLGLENDIQRKS